MANKAINRAFLKDALQSYNERIDDAVVGAQPTDTVRNILSREGVYMMKHLRGGVKKGAFDEAAAQTKFDAWKQAKESGLIAIKEKEAAAKKQAQLAALENEKKVNAAKAAAIAEKKAAALAAEAPAEEATEEAAEA